MGKCKLLSLCIPTNGAVQFVLPLLDSIYSQEIDDNLFEVVITDNGKDSVLETVVNDYGKHNNLFYYKSNKQGFLNQVDSFKKSNGLFIKMLNHRAKLLPGALKDFLNLVDNYKQTQPCIFCAANLLEKPEYSEFKDLDSFVDALSIYSSWSGGVGIWQKDKYMLDRIEYNKMFPHASIMFESRTDSDYVIWNRQFMDIKEDSTKGGYRIFHTFAVVYLDILKDLEVRGRITHRTFLNVKKDLLKFLSKWYYKIFKVPNQFTFITDNYKKDILVYYNYLDYIYLKLWANLKWIPKYIKRKLKNDKSTP